MKPVLLEPLNKLARPLQSEYDLFTYQIIWGALCVMAIIDRNGLRDPRSNL